MNEPQNERNIPHIINESTITSVNNTNEIIVENISLIYIYIYTLILCVKAIANGEFFIVQLFVAKLRRKPIIATIVILITNSLL